MPLINGEWAPECGHTLAEGGWTKTCAALPKGHDGPHLYNVYRGCYLGGD